MSKNREIKKLKKRIKELEAQVKILGGSVSTLIDPTNDPIAD